jgi:protein with PEP-CTERM/exosortase system signal
MDAYSVLFKHLASAQSLLFYYAMKSNTLLNKLVLVSAAVCALMLAFSHNVSATGNPMPPTINNVPDGGTTALLLGAAIGALGLARRLVLR